MSTEKAKIQPKVIAEEVVKRKEVTNENINQSIVKNNDEDSESKHSIEVTTSTAGNTPMMNEEKFDTIPTKPKQSPRVVMMDEEIKEVKSLAIMYQNFPEFLIYSANLAEQCERYEEMMDIMKSSCMQNQELTKQERNLFSVSFKNVIGSKRAAWRVINSIEEKNDSDVNNQRLTQAYKSKIELEIIDLCNKTIDFLTINVLPKVITSEGKVFFNKMKADNCRYLSEFSNCLIEFSKRAYDSYIEATEIANNELASTEPIRLGLALNFSGIFILFISFYHSISHFNLHFNSHFNSYFNSHFNSHFNLHFNSHFNLHFNFHFNLHFNSYFNSHLNFNFNNYSNFL